MTDKRKIFVLFFAVFLALVPQGIYWYQPEELNLILGIPYYLYHSASNIAVETLHWSIPETHVYNCGEIIGGKFIGIKLVAHLYVVVVLVLLAEYLYQIMKKKHIKKTIEYTTKIYVLVATVQFVVSLFFFKKSWVHPDTWKWMWEITFIQLIISLAFYASVHGTERNLERKKGFLIKDILYIALLLISYYSTGFRKLYKEHTDNDIVWGNYNMFFVDTRGEEYRNQFLLIRIIIVVFCLGIMFIVFKCMEEKVRESLIVKIETGLYWITIEYFIWIIYAGVFSVRMQESEWFFMPGIINIVLISWGCWRLTGVGEKGFASSE